MSHRADGLNDVFDHNVLVKDQLICDTEPTEDNHVANKVYVDTHGGGGGAVTSVFSRTGDVVAETNDYTWAKVDKTTSSIADITTKSHTSLTDKGTNTHAQVDTHIADTSIHTEDNLLVHNSGDETVAGIKTFTSIPVLPSSNPTTDNQAVRKAYVDSYASGAIWKEACKSSTTDVLPACTYSGTPNFTLTGNSNGALPDQDGQSVSNGDRLLVKNQADAKQNGIYVVTAVGTIGTRFVLTRGTDYNSNGEVQEGTCLFIILGTANGGKTFVQITINPVLDLNDLVFTQMNTSTSYTASLGCELVGTDIRSDLLSTGAIVLTGNEIGVAVDGSSLELNTNAIRVKASGITNTMLAGSIADSKLDQITTASKVSGAALTSLPNIPSGAGVIPAANLGTGGTGSNYLKSNGTFSTPSGTATTDYNYYRQPGTNPECWYCSIISASSLTTSTMTANRLYALPFVVNTDCVLDRIAIYVSTAVVSTKARLGIYIKSAGAPSSIMPGILVLDAGEVDTSTVGVKSITINQTLSPGLYYLVAVSNGAIGVRMENGNVSSILGISSGLGPTFNQYVYCSFTYGALPGTFPAVSLSVGASVVVFVRLSS